MKVWTGSSLVSGGCSSCSSRPLVPTGDGDEAVRLCGSGLPQIPIVLLTTHGGEIGHLAARPHPRASSIFPISQEIPLGPEAVMMHREPWDQVVADAAPCDPIAHEVNQPLSGIITNASTCLRMLAADPPDVDGARETARRTIRDGNRASDVIARVRALFTKKESAIEAVDLNEVTGEVIALLLSDLQRNRVVLRSELAKDLPAIAGDRIQLQQVILNLLRNACDAMADVHDRPRQLLIRTERGDGDRVRVSVQDAGVGVDPRNLDKLLDAFYTTKTDGMGIGLSISRSIIERHHGRLWAEANDGPGATFSFSIPSGPASVPDAAPR